jgi:hypothetical protein
MGTRASIQGKARPEFRNYKNSLNLVRDSRTNLPERLFKEALLQSLAKE